jgi:hypothetical protein
MDIGKTSMLNFSFEDNVSELKSIMKRSVGHFPSELYSDRPFPCFGCSSGVDFGQLAYKRLGKRENNFGRVPFASFKLGDELYIYDDISNLFKRDIDISKASSAGVVVACYNPKVGNTAKTLLFDYLDFTQPEFDPSGDYHLLPWTKKTGNIICAKTSEHHDVYDTIHQCRNEKEIWEAIKGKCLRVVDIVETVKGIYMSHRDAFFRHLDDKGERIDIRKVPVFEFVDKNPIFLPDYDPRFFYEDYRIVSSEDKERWGIVNVRTNETVVPCLFDDIKWGESFWREAPVSEDDVNKSATRKFEYVRFYKFGMKALFRISDLDKIQFLDFGK